jgi:hypothetical protein
LSKINNKKEGMGWLSNILSSERRKERTLCIEQQQQVRKGAPWRRALPSSVIFIEGSGAERSTLVPMDGWSHYPKIKSRQLKKTNACPSFELKQQLIFFSLASASNALPPQQGVTSFLTSVSFFFLQGHKGVATAV